MSDTEAWRLGYEAGRKRGLASQGFVEIPIPAEMAAEQRGDFIAGFGRGMRDADDDILIDEIMDRYRGPA